MHEPLFLKLRKSMGLTQAQMAKLLRLPVATVKTLEAGSLDSVTTKKLVRIIMAKDGRGSVTGSGGTSVRHTNPSRRSFETAGVTSSSRW